MKLDRIVMWVLTIISGLLLLAAGEAVHQYDRLVIRVETLEREHGSMQARLDLLYRHHDPARMHSPPTWRGTP